MKFQSVGIFRAFDAAYLGFVGFLFGSSLLVLAGFDGTGHGCDRRGVVALEGNRMRPRSRNQLRKWKAGVVWQEGGGGLCDVKIAQVVVW